MVTAARASGPKTRKAGAGTPTSANFFNSSDIADSIQERQVQFLASRFAMPVSIASTIAALAWGVRHG